MSRTKRQVPSSPAGMRHPQTFNEIKQRSAVEEEEEYQVSSRARKPPTAWDDIVATSVYQEDHHE